MARFTNTHLKKIVLVKFLEYTSFNLHKVVAHHDGEERLVAGVDGHVERGGLEQEEHGVEEHVGDGQHHVRDHADVLSLLPPLLCCGPEQGVNSILTKSLTM